MGLVYDRGRYYWVKRIPKRFAGLVLGVDSKLVSQVRQRPRYSTRSTPTTSVFARSPCWFLLVTAGIQHGTPLRTLGPPGTLKGLWWLSQVLPLKSRPDQGNW